MRIVAVLSEAQRAGHDRSGDQQPGDDTGKHVGNSDAAVPVHDDLAP